MMRLMSLISRELSISKRFKLKRKPQRWNNREAFVPQEPERSSSKRTVDSKNEIRMWRLLGDIPVSCYTLRGNFVCLINGSNTAVFSKIIL
jgi:hypothetical protein